MISACVLAHNEERHIRRCLESLPRSIGAEDLRIVVVANGCSDRTVERARGASRDGVPVDIVELPVGDKASAWNSYVDSSPLDARHHVFMDGDCYAHPGSIEALIAALEDHPHANAAAGVPSQGRNRNATVRGILEHGDLAGGLYALRGSFVARLKAHSIRLPAGAIGDDSLIGMLAKIDLRTEGPWKDERIVGCPDALYGFDQIELTRPRHLMQMIRRLRRYCLRDIQNQALRTVWKREGLTAWPSDIRSLYHGILDGRYPYKLRGPVAAFTPLARREMRAALRAAAPADAGAKGCRSTV